MAGGKPGAATPIPRARFMEVAQFCAICAQAKGERRQPKKSKRVYTRKFQALSIDICCPTITSIHGYQYFAIMVDPYDNTYYYFLLKQKKDLLPQLTNWFRSHFRRDKKTLTQFEVPLIETWEQRGIDFFRSDGGGVMQGQGFKDLLAEYFVQDVQVSVAYHHAGNALSEAAIKIVCKMARAIMIQYNEPTMPGLWEYAVPEAVRIYCRTGSVANPDNKSSYEMNYGKPPDWSGFRPHGGICYPVRPIAEGSSSKNAEIPILYRGDKFAPRTFTGKFLGFPAGKKGYLVLLIGKKYRSRPRVGCFQTVYFDCRRIGNERIPCHIAGGMRNRWKLAAQQFVEANPHLIKEELDGKHLFKIFLEAMTPKEGEEIFSSFAERPPQPKLGCSKTYKNKPCPGEAEGCYYCRRPLYLYRKTYNLRPLAITGCHKCRYGESKCKKCAGVRKAFDDDHPDYVEPEAVAPRPTFQELFEFMQSKDVDAENSNTPTSSNNQWIADVAFNVCDKAIKKSQLDIAFAHSGYLADVPRVVIPGSEDVQNFPLIIPKDCVNAVFQTLAEIVHSRTLKPCGLIPFADSVNNVVIDGPPSVEDINFMHKESERYYNVILSDVKSRMEQGRLRRKQRLENVDVRRKLIDRAIEGSCMTEKPDAVILITDDQNNRYFVPIPDNAFIPVFGIAEGQVPDGEGKTRNGAMATFSHIEYVNTMTLGQTQFSARFVPKNGAQALKSEVWKTEAMMPEMKSLVDMGCFAVVPADSVPSGQKLISGRWVFVQKHDADGKPTKKKGRYVARGFSCREGIHYQANHTYAPVASPEAIRAQLNFAAHRKQHVHQLDIGNAFIIPELEEEVYMPVPLGLKEYYKEAGIPFPEGKCVVKVLRSLYGLKNSAFLFNRTLVNALKKLNFVETSEPCVYVRHEKDGSYSTVSIYVDDLVIAFSDEKIMEEFKKALGDVNTLFKIDDRGEVKHLLGVRIDYDRENGKFTLSQKGYIEKLFNRFNLAEIEKQLMPMDANQALMFSKPPKYEAYMLKEGKSWNSNRCDATKYKEVIGSALHAIKWTRVDAMTAVCMQATAMHMPTEEALTVALKTLRYMYDTRDLKLYYDCASAEPTFTAHCDSDLAGWHNGKSRIGWLVKFGGPLDKNAPICFYSKLRNPIYDNTPDSEQAGLTECSHSIFWLRNFAHSCGFQGFDPVSYESSPITSRSSHDDGRAPSVVPTEDLKMCTVFCDNNPTISRCDKPGRWQAKRKVHINNCKSVEYCNPDSALRICDLKYIKSAENNADVLTKCSADKFGYIHLRMKIMNLPSKWG